MLSNHSICMDPEIVEWEAAQLQIAALNAELARMFSIN